MVQRSSTNWIGGEPACGLPDGEARMDRNNLQAPERPSLHDHLNAVHNIAPVVDDVIDRVMSTHS
jgi:hypothetical protein